jgi:hypothetical protein
VRREIGYRYEAGRQQALRCLRDDGSAADGKGLVRPLMAVRVRHGMARRAALHLRGEPSVRALGLHRALCSWGVVGACDFAMART